MQHSNRNRKEVWIPSAEEIEQERKRLRYHSEFYRVLRSTIVVLVATASVAVLLATLLLPILQVTGESMEPTLSDGQVVVLWNTDAFDAGDLCGFYFQNKILLKRVIGSPGDWINIKDDGRVYVNGELLDEPYVDEFSVGECDIEFPYQVPENRYFVLGDHRSVSIDSRSTTVGCVESSQLVGKVFLRIWPFPQFGWLN